MVFAPPAARAPITFLGQQYSTSLGLFHLYITLQVVIMLKRLYFSSNALSGAKQNYWLVIYHTPGPLSELQAVIRTSAYLDISTPPIQIDKSHLPVNIEVSAFIKDSRRVIVRSTGHGRSRMILPLDLAG
jgi:hypothetical protein